MKIQYYLLISLAYLNVSWAQENSSLDKVVVKARKMEEQAQSLSLSVGVLSESDLDALGTPTVRELSHEVPNFVIVGAPTGRYSAPYIRGLGNQDPSLPDDISVNFYLDEVPLPRYSFDLELFELQAVEVLRGPQGTLFGKNTQGGAVLLQSKAPVPGESEIHLEVGNQKARALRAATSFGNKEETWANRLSFGYRERDGFIKDVLQNKDLNDFERIHASDSFVYIPTDSFKITARVGVQKEKGSDPNFIARGTDEYPITGQDISPDYQTTLVTPNVKWEKDLSAYRLIGIHAFNYHSFKVKYDETDQFIALSSPRLSNQPLSSINNPDRFYRDVSEYERGHFHELRLELKKSEDLSWVSGINYSLTKYRLMFFVDTQDTGMGPPVQKSIEQDIELTSQYAALFSEASKDLTKKWNFTLGARLNIDKKSFESQHNSQGMQTLSYQQDSDETYSDVTGKLSLAYKFTQQHLSYLSITRGYRPGGYPAFQFNNYADVATDQAPFLSSTSLTYEWGAKTSWLNERFRSNVAMFLNDLKGNQVRIRDATSKLSFYENVRTRILGAEWENTFKATTDLTFGLNLGYLKGYFREKKEIPSNPDIEKGGSIANSPDWTSVTSVQYSPFLSSLNGFLSTRLSHRYIGQRFGDNINRVKLSSYGLWDARVAVEKDRFYTAFRINNIFDKKYESQGYYFGSLDTEVSSPGLPRLYVVELGLRF